MKGFTHQVRLGKKIVAITSDEKIGRILVLTLTKMFWLRDLDRKTMLNLILDFVSLLASEAPKSPNKNGKKATTSKAGKS
jgi:hypothetical protein